MNSHQDAWYSSCVHHQNFNKTLFTSKQPLSLCLILNMGILHTFFYYVFILFIVVGILMLFTELLSYINKKRNRGRVLKIQSQNIENYEAKRNMFLEKLEKKLEQEKKEVVDKDKDLKKKKYEQTQKEFAKTKKFKLNKEETLQEKRERRKEERLKKKQQKERAQKRLMKEREKKFKEKKRVTNNLKKNLKVKEENLREIENKHVLNSQNTDDRNIIKEQDDEYERALESDRENERLKQQINNNNIEQQQEIKKKEVEVEVEVEAPINTPTELEKKIYEEKLKSLPNEPQFDNENISKLIIRLPDGNKVVRRFNATDKLIHLFNYVETLLFPEFINFKFTIMTDYPRKFYSEPNITFKKAGLLSKNKLGVVLFVNIIENDEEQQSKSDFIIDTCTDDISDLI
eukprot:TRINITY_DN1748_c0_g2_i1.p1 TRINITY_DN1748_c0_g2~~TRINITY_DN1748_c0_g2_i1.p1  ORF type:complete len:402 (+),score=114.90 TRINITY_DN1748_c0_g2_i1:162-1367(+)